MPILQSSYKASTIYHRHLSTIYMGRLRRIAYPQYQRERISFDGDDFLDLDWIKSKNKKLVVISHGLEGSSSSHAVRSLTNCLSCQGYDVLAVNFRGCSGEPNRRLASYNSGSSDQLAFIINTIVARNEYDSIHLVGISVGGNITLKYLGEAGNDLPKELVAAVGISVPCDLSGSSTALSRLENRIYLWDFLKSLKSKIVSKAHLLPEKLDYKKLQRIKNFEEFDEEYTAPIHGYTSAQEYYAKSSSLYKLEGIRLPTLLLTARDDPFLSPSCYPDEIASISDFLFLEASKFGGHVAFPMSAGRSWLDLRVKQFLILFECR